jgi:hypothetical protein
VTIVAKHWRHQRLHKKHVARAFSTFAKTRTCRRTAPAPHLHNSHLHLEAALGSGEVLKCPLHDVPCRRTAATMIRGPSPRDLAGLHRIGSWRKDGWMSKRGVPTFIIGAFPRLFWSNYYFWRGRETPAPCAERSTTRLSYKTRCI